MLHAFNARVAATQRVRQQGVDLLLAHRALETKVHIRGRRKANVTSSLHGDHSKTNLTMIIEKHSSQPSFWNGLHVGNRRRLSSG
jgi:hypothetical protein